jgi:uncharacterized spore protein YtfJ
VKRAPEAGEHHKSETIIGQPQQAGEATVIPVHRLKIAFGAANAKAGVHAGKTGADSGGQGAGGAVELDPVAAIAVGKDGHAHLLTVESDSYSSWSQLIAEVPDLVAKLAHTVGDGVRPATTAARQRDESSSPFLASICESTASLARARR